MSDREQRKRSAPRWPINVAVLMVLVGSVLATVQVNSRALAERRLEARVLEAELATHTIATIDLIEFVPPGVEREYELAVHMLQGEIEKTLAALPLSERAIAREQAELVLRHIEQGSSAPEEVIRPLLESLQEARLATGEQAAATEQTTRLLMVLATGTAMAAVFVLLMGWRREQRLQESLRDQANTDVLTGLSNRRAIELRIDEARYATKTRSCHTGVLYLDLDGFKGVNDTMGHEAGDTLLQLVAERMVAVRSGEESLLRLGGDEFAVLLPCMSNATEADIAAQRYLEIFSEPFVIAGRVEHVRVSVGIASTDDPMRVDGLFADADMATFAAKRHGGNCIRRFDYSMRSDAEAMASMRSALRSADYDEEFHLVFQPVVSVTSGETLFVEALLRWESPILGSVSPGQFIPVAESTGEISAIGQWVLRSVVARLAAWQDDPDFADISISCNVSAIQLDDDGFVDRLVDLLEAAQVAPNRLIVEVTESVAMDEEGVSNDVLKALRDNGIQIAVDDFGAGYANLSQLFRVSFDILKVDRLLLVRLTDGAEHSVQGAALAKGVFSSLAQLTTSLGASLVCEGVETQEQWALLARSGVSHMQGWLSGRPVTADKLKADPALPQAS